MQYTLLRNRSVVDTNLVCQGHAIGCFPACSGGHHSCAQPAASCGAQTLTRCKQNTAAHGTTSWLALASKIYDLISCNATMLDVVAGVSTNKGIAWLHEAALQSIIHRLRHLDLARKFCNIPTETRSTCTHPHARARRLV
jgi:hypothetical protein